MLDEKTRKGKKDENDRVTIVVETNVKPVQNKIPRDDRLVRIAVLFVQDLKERETNGQTMEKIFRRTRAFRSDVFHQTGHVDFRIETFVIDVMQKHVDGDRRARSTDSGTAMNDHWRRGRFVLMSEAFEKF